MHNCFNTVLALLVFSSLILHVYDYQNEDNKAYYNITGDNISLTAHEWYPDISYMGHFNCSNNTEYYFVYNITDDMYKQMKGYAFGQ